MTAPADIARALGFTHVAPISANEVVTSEELTASCNPQACRKYASCWTCPPAAGTFQELLSDITSKKAGVLVQTVRDDIDMYEDWGLLGETRDEHNAKLDRLAAELRRSFKGVAEFSTGGCDLCSPCSYPNAPCNRPDEQRLSLSAHGVAVGATCKNVGLDYSFQNGRVRFVGMVLYEDEL